MSGVSRWRESGHLERAVETAGGQEAFDAAVAAMLNQRAPAPSQPWFRDCAPPKSRHFTL